jgi:hypothetical protein
MQIESKKTIESTTAPGVTFTVRRLNRIQRAKRDLGCMDARLRFTAAIERYRDLEKVKEGARTPEQETEMRALDYEAGLIVNEHLKPASISAALTAITGLEIDGKPATVAAIIENGGPEVDELLDEIYTACEAASGLSGAETKNSQSPSTLPVATDGETIATIAETAG